MCPLGVGRKVAKTRTRAQHSQPGQAAASSLLGLHRQESMADSQLHTERYSQSHTQICTHPTFTSKYTHNSITHPGMYTHVPITHTGLHVPVPITCTHMDVCIYATHMQTCCIYMCVVHMCLHMYLHVVHSTFMCFWAHQSAFLCTYASK